MGGKINQTCRGQCAHPPVSLHLKCTRKQKYSSLFIILYVNIPLNCPHPALAIMFIRDSMETERQSRPSAALPNREEKFSIPLLHSNITHFEVGNYLDFFRKAVMLETACLLHSKHRKQPRVNTHVNRLQTVTQQTFDCCGFDKKTVASLYEQKNRVRL